ncbi:hypothetical protein IJ579_04905 [bacterium]|nr:hypothetical protein [bacterium]
MDSVSLPSFKGLYDATAYVQNHTLINRGITTIGGSTVPQCIMSNNKYEAQERALMGGIYFVASYLTPIMLIPLYNKHFLKNKGIIKELESIGKRIIQVPKKYLKPDADLKKGLEETAKIFDEKAHNTKTKEAFEEIYSRYNDPAKLKSDLLSVHEKILTTDFITTAAMWSAIPWVATEFTEHRTKRTDFSGGFYLKDDNSKTTKEHKKSKNKKIIGNILFSVVPGILFAKAVTKGLSSKNFSNNIYGKLLKHISDNPHNFDYTSGTNMSKTIYAAIWVLSSFPAKIISSRDSNERRDRTLRDVGLFTMFFGGDFLINNIAGRFADRIFGTRIMDTEKYKGQNLNFFEKFKLSLKNFKDIPNIEGMTPEVMKRTKNIGAGLYWFSLLTNTALIGFALPKVLNKFLRYNISKENFNQQKSNLSLQKTISMDKFIS